MMKKKVSNSNKPLFASVDNFETTVDDAPFNKILAQIRERISSDSFERWFRELAWGGDDGSTCTFIVPNAIHQFFLESNYLPILEVVVDSVLGAPRKIAFLTNEHPEDESHHTNSSSEAPTRRTEKNEDCRGAPLNPRNTFESFVVGPNNQFAYAAAFAVAKAPALHYNPLFIYGGSGLGKTHLLHAIGHAVLHNKKTARIAYLTSEQFTNEFIDALQHGTLVKFRKKYRHADVLLIDDIHFFAGKERSQEEFFHTFNALHDGHKQIVLTSDRPACEIEKLEQRLVSRFEWGMTAEIQPPDVETRIAILKSKAASLQIRIENWVLEYLADRIRNNVRRLEGALTRVASYQSISGQPVSRNTLDNLLRDIFQEQARRAVTIEQIQRKVAETFDVRFADMTSKRRPANIAFPRQVAMYLARELTDASLTDIGEAFGGRDHGTVLHAHRLIKKRIAEDEKIRHTINSITSQLQR
ncbi:MAG: chromosomal replication initiator protein DnaA [Chthoniobacterales bacterium]|nr:chromosomal replication initiator protein DnaA [Chthoniobacterales bacterium]